MGAQGYQSFLLSKPVVGLNIALHAVPADRASVLHSWLIQLNFPPISPVLNGEICVVLSSESEFVLVVGIHFVSP